MRNLQFVEGEIYHVYNRGVDKRSIFIDLKDFERFLECMDILNFNGTLGSLERVLSRRKHGVFTSVEEKGKLVKFIAYCVNQNHFHLLLEPLTEGGIERFMHKLEMSHSKYINAKYKRSGALFQGSFQAKRVDSNEYLLHLSAYINLNHLSHGRGYSVPTLAKTSWGEYIGESKDKGLCDKKVVLEQFKSHGAYKKFAENSLKSIIEQKILLEELEEVGIEPIFTR